MSGRGLGAIGKPGREVVKDPRILDQVRPRPQRLRGADCEPLLEETDKTEPVVRRLVPVPKALRGEGSEQQRQRLVCQGGIRSACPGAPSPTFPRPARAARARDLWGDARGFESRFGSLRTTCAHGLRRGRLGKCPGREGGHAAGTVQRRRPSPPTLAGGQDKMAQPNFSLRPGEGSVVRPLEREAAAARSTHGLAFCFSSLRTRERHNSIISFTCHAAFSSFALQPSAFRRGLSQSSNKPLSLKSLWVLK